MRRRVEVRVTDQDGNLVDRFNASGDYPGVASGLADDRLRKLTAKFARCEPGTKLTVTRSDRKPR